MGRKSGQIARGYDPRIHKMHWTMFQRELIREQEYRMMNKKKMRFAYWTQRMTNAVSCLRTVDPEGWERWYDNDSNVPADCTRRELAYLIEARVAELTGSFPRIRARAWQDIFIWQDWLGFFVYSKEVGKDTLYIIEFSSIEEARTFITGLPFVNRGYGVVLDLLPAAAISQALIVSE